MSKFLPYLLFILLAFVACFAAASFLKYRFYRVGRNQFGLRVRGNDFFIDESNHWEDLRHGPLSRVLGLAFAFNVPKTDGSVGWLLIPEVKKVRQYASDDDQVDWKKAAASEQAMFIKEPTLKINSALFVLESLGIAVAISCFCFVIWECFW
jgi:hypothetical protein